MPYLNSNQQDEIASQINRVIKANGFDVKWESRYEGTYVKDNVSIYISKYGFYSYDRSVRISSEEAYSSSCYRKKTISVRKTTFTDEQILKKINSAYERSKEIYEEAQEVRKQRKIRQEQDNKLEEAQSKLPEKFTSFYNAARVNYKYNVEIGQFRADNIEKIDEVIKFLQELKEEVTK